MIKLQAQDTEQLKKEKTKKKISTNQNVEHEAQSHL